MKNLAVLVLAQVLCLSACAADSPARTFRSGKTSIVASDLQQTYQSQCTGSAPACPHCIVTIDAISKTDAARLLTELQDIGLGDGQTAGPLVSGRLPLCQAVKLETCCTQLRFVRMAQPVHRKTR